VGTFLGDFFLTAVGLSNPLLSLVAGVPGNFVGFYIFGWLAQRARSWRAFPWVSVVAVFVGNLVAATGVVAFFTLITDIGWAGWPLAVKVATIFGFTLFWAATMFPFILALVPLLVRAAYRWPLTRSLVTGREWEPTTSRGVFSSSLSAGLLLVALFALVSYTPLGDLVFSQILVPEVAGSVKLLILVAGVSVVVFGPLAPRLGVPEPEARP
jgi:hypothetical protein